jgi:hypothetical protein
MTTAAAKTLAERKVRRQKLFVAVGSVVLLAVLGFELPKVLGGGSSDTAPAPAVATAAEPSAVGPVPPASVATLPDTDRLVVRSDSDQLLSFGLFKSKDPFVQQLSPTASAPASSTPAAPAVKTPAKTTKVRKATPKVPSPSPIGVGLTPAATTTTAPTTPAAPSPPAVPETPATTPVAPATPSETTPAAPAGTPTSVLISTNGICETVALKATFPGDEDIFRVLAIDQDGKSVEIGVVGGSYDSGQASATLKLGDKLTLVNTADGTRYVIALKSRCEVATERTAGRGTPPAATTSAAITPVPPAPTGSTPPSATTPIVTDALDTTTPSS